MSSSFFLVSHSIVVNYFVDLDRILHLDISHSVCVDEYGCDGVLLAHFASALGGVPK